MNASNCVKFNLDFLKLFLNGNIESGIVVNI